MGHLNGILAWVGGNLNDNFQKSQMPGGGGGMLRLRFDRYITAKKCTKKRDARASLLLSLLLSKGGLSRVPKYGT